MKHLVTPNPLNVTLAVLLTLFASCPSAVLADLIELKKCRGAIDFSTDGISRFVLTGNMPHLGRFAAYGEVEFIPGEEEGSLIGLGVAVFQAANGDLLVGNVTWAISGDGADFRASRIQFHWTDSVEFNNGLVVSNTGRFVDDRPPGLVVIAIIAILIGLLLPR